MIRFVSLMLIALSLSACSDNSMPAYKNPELPVEKRVADLLSRMTEEEKFWQMFMIPGDLEEDMSRYHNGIFGFQVSTRGKSLSAAGQMLDYGSSGPVGEVAEKINLIQKYFIEETRLGIPIIPFDEALHGLVREGATAYPQSIALAATWDTDLMGRVASEIAEETGTRGIRQILSPVVNIARDVRWGRTEETYGEDPYLTSKMGVAFVKEFEKRGIITTPKHFVANVGAGGRDSYPVHFNERIMEEIYFPAFKACFQEGGSRSVMTSYNSYDGTPCTANKWVLRDKLKKEWGFNGFVISDAGATGGANVLHFTAEDYPGSTTNAINGGLDVIFQTSYDHYPLFWPAFNNGTIPQEIIDDAVRRVLRAKFELGLFEEPYVDTEKAVSANGTADHLNTALEAAQKSIVLLKNKNNTLPVKKEVQSIALIGTDATEARLGGYSGPGIRRNSILQGLQEICDKRLEINFTEGPGRDYREYETVAGKYLTNRNYGDKKAGLHGEYFNNNTLSGSPVLVREDPAIRFGWTLFSPDTSLAYDWYSVRWTGQITPPQSGIFKIGLEGNDGYRLYINDDLLIDNWVKKSYSGNTTDFRFEAGREYDIKVEFFESTGNSKIRLIWNQEIENIAEDKIEEAVKLVSESDLAVVVAGIDEGEFQDRATLALPGLQEELINRVAATGKPVVVVIIGGSAVTMTSWLHNVDAVINAWYPGDMGGIAVANVLMGNYNPAGRLPVTFPIDEAQLPLYYNHKPTGRGDDYMNLTGHPLFPFGYGLSYTDFEYSSLEISEPLISPTGKTEVSCIIKNSGNYKGDEVIQLYIRDEIASVARPVMELRGFSRITLAPSETKKVIFELGPDELSMLNRELERVVEPGRIRIMVGSSSRDIRLRSHITIK